MQAVFYTFSKKENSTAQPGGGVSKNVHLKAGCSALAPTISLEWPGSGAPVSYNYMYISEFGRYYYIENWTWENRLWTCTGRVDVLASWKSQIGAANKYVLRAASDFDPDVIDTIYPAILPAKTKITAGSAAAWATTFGGGAFIVGIVGQGNTYNINGAGYVVMTAGQIQQLIDACFTETDNLWSQPVTPTADLAEALNEYGSKYAKSIQNPIQFINGITWVPFWPSTGGAVSVNLGHMNTGISAYALDQPIYTRLIQFADILAPINTAAGAWRAVEPFCRYKLIIPPFGVFDLDAAVVNRFGGTVNGTYYVDCLTGQATLNIYDFGILASAELGIQISLSGNMVNYAGQAEAIANAATGFIGKLLSGDIGGAIAGGVSGINSVASASSPVATRGAVGGGMAALNTPKYAVATYYDAAPEDVTDRGRPLARIRTLSNLSGYILCADGEISAPASKAELEEIRSYLTGGFYYE